MFEAVKILSGAIMTYLSKPIDCIPPRVKLSNCELQLIMMVSVCALIIASVTSLVWGAERGGGYSCVGAGSVWRFLCLPVSFAVNLKLL